MLGPQDILYPCYAMNVPFSLDNSAPNNIFVKELPPNERQINHHKALRQFLDLYNYLSSIALIYLIPSRPGLQDEPFVANLGIVLPHLQQHPVVVSNFKSPPRRGETPMGVQFFRLMGQEPIIAPPYFEGEADLKYVRDNIYLGAYGMRTTVEALRWFRERFEMEIIPIRLHNEYLYHLDCVIFPITTEHIIVNVAAVEPQTVKAIEKIAEVIPVDKNIATWGATNNVRVRRMVFANSAIDEYRTTDEEYPKERAKVDFLTKVCTRLGMEPVFFNLSEFAKSGADLSCMVMHLNYADYLPGRSV